MHRNEFDYDLLLDPRVRTTGELLLMKCCVTILLKLYFFDLYVVTCKVFAWQSGGANCNYFLINCFDVLQAAIVYVFKLATVDGEKLKVFILHGPAVYV